MTAYIRKASRAEIRLLEIEIMKTPIDHLLTTAIRTSITAMLPMGWSILHLDTQCVDHSSFYLDMEKWIPLGKSIHFIESLTHSDTLDYGVPFP